MIDQEKEVSNEAEKAKCEIITQESEVQTDGTFLEENCLLEVQGNYEKLVKVCSIIFN